jgi:predicted solute-binding protein
MDLTFAVPSTCADRVVAGDSDVGIVPAIEVARHGLEYVPGVALACRGPVRSILLVSRKPYEAIQTLAADSGSRTSVELSRIILAQRYGAFPSLQPMEPDLDAMLKRADAALIIGDAALRLEPSESGLPTLDLGEEWVEMTGLPFVFAVWAGRPDRVTPEVGELLQASCDFGLRNLDDIIMEEAERRVFPEQLVHQYLTWNMTYSLGEEEEAGLELFWQYARELDPVVNGGGERAARRSPSHD